MLLKSDIRWSWEIQSLWTKKWKGIFRKIISTQSSVSVINVLYLRNVMTKEYLNFCCHKCLISLLNSAINDHIKELLLNNQILFNALNNTADNDVGFLYSNADCHSDKGPYCSKIDQIHDSYIHRNKAFYDKFEKNSHVSS